MEDPTLNDSWLLRKNDPALPRIIAAVRPSILPKLREENERMRTKNKGKKKGAIKDVVAQGQAIAQHTGPSKLIPLIDDFQVSIFLKDQTTRHSLLVKKKEFSDKPPLKSNSNKLTNWLSGGDGHDPIDVDAPHAPVLIEDDDDVDINDIPTATSNIDEDAVTIPSDDDGPDNSLFVSGKDIDANGDDKKKLGMKTIFDGFAIYGKFLCLIVKRTNMPSTIKAGASGRAMLENWVSTQVAQEMGLDEEG
jgi:hypothetical protein